MGQNLISLALKPKILQKMALNYLFISIKIKNYKIKIKIKNYKIKNYKIKIKINLKLK